MAASRVGADRLSLSCLAHGRRTLTSNTAESCNRTGYGDGLSALSTTAPRKSAGIEAALNRSGAPLATRSEWSAGPIHQFRTAGPYSSKV